MLPARQTWPTSTPWVLPGVLGPFQVSIDPNGNLTSDGTTTYQYDVEDRLVAVLQGSTTLATFTYDGRARRATKAAGGTTHSYVYDGGNIVEDRLSNGQTVDYVQGPSSDQHLSQRDQTGLVTYDLSDHLGSIALLTNISGAVTLARQYDPWGNLLQGSSTPGYAFTGREWDQETGLYYYRARYYYPALGRFVSEDNRGSGASLFSYVDNNPIGFKDPLGHYKCTYNISDHSMTCVPDNPDNPSYDSHDWAAGNNGTVRSPRTGQQTTCDDCLNNKHMTAVEDHGPPPEGEYVIGPNRSGRRNLTPDPAGRTGLQLHACAVPGYSGPGAVCSTGCITGSYASFGLLDRYLSLERHNTLTVVPGLTSEEWPWEQ